MSTTSKQEHQQSASIIIIIIIIMGFSKTIIRTGNGIKPKQGQTVTVHCTGYGKDSDLTQPFWSTHDEGQQPFEFTVGEGHVIKGE